jgi:hypothetical protein
MRQEFSSNQKGKLSHVEGSRSSRIYEARRRSASSGTASNFPLCSPLIRKIRKVWSQNIWRNKSFVSMLNGAASETLWS